MDRNRGSGQLGAWVSSSQYWYRTCGLVLVSDRRLPGPSPVAPCRADLTYEMDREGEISTDPAPGDLLAEMHGPDGGTIYTASATEDGFLLRFPGRSEYSISGDLTSVRYRIDPREDAEVVELLLAGTVLALVLSLGGTTVLHATALEIDGRAIAFVGHSGQGKSTLACAAAVAGAALLAEDVLALASDESAHPGCLRGNLEIRLRGGAVSLLDGEASWPVEPSAHGRVTVKPPASTRDCVPLHAVAIPRRGRVESGLQVSRLAASRALRAILSTPRILGLTYPAAIEHQFRSVSHLVTRVPVYVLDMPEGPPFPQDLGERLTALIDP